MGTAEYEMTVAGSNCVEGHGLSLEPSGSAQRVGAALLLLSPHHPIADLRSAADERGAG